MSFSARGGKAKISFGKLSLPSKPVEPVVDEEKKAEETHVSTSGFGVFGKIDKPSASSSSFKEDDSFAKMMGFTEFGSSKKTAVKKAAKAFDVKDMVDAIKESRKKAEAEKRLARIREGLGGGDDDDDDEEDDEEKDTTIKAEEEEAKEDKNEENEEEVIGPVPATDPNQRKEKEEKKKLKKKDDDDESDDSDDDSLR